MRSVREGKMPYCLKSVMHIQSGVKKGGQPLFVLKQVLEYIAALTTLLN